MYLNEHLFIISTCYYFKCGRKNEKLPFYQRFLANLYNFITNKLGLFLGTTRPLPQKIVSLFKEFTNKQFDFKKYDTSDIYWLSYCYVCDNNSKFQQLLINWFQLYSYARNIATALYLSFIYCLFSFLWHFQIGYNLDLFTKIFLISVYLGSFIMLIRYYYLYVSYYSKFLIRSCIYLHKKNQTDFD